MQDQMDCLMHTDLMGIRKELSEAQEEIAVKVAQVKQYQKQVEAYKQQLEQVLCKHLIIDINACTCAIVYCTFGGAGGGIYSQCTSLLTDVIYCTCMFMCMNECFCILRCMNMAVLHICLWNPFASISTSMNATW